MSPAPPRRAPHPRNRHAWMRVLALLVVAFLAAGAQAGALSAAAPVAVAVTVADASGHGAEPDVPDTALRPPGRPGHDRVIPPRPTRGTAPGHPDPASRPGPAAASPTAAPHVPRSVVLRC
ncbi:hypothetical protein ABZV34_11355 [Streptomyces sp. NPDC005195]|uniref:hypothetical protein n=1 Tax=Streptomyces sp. NPDC005195 TaxID=3154561 RepID=UPI0033A513B5